QKHHRQVCLLKNHVGEERRHQLLAGHWSRLSSFTLVHKNYSFRTRSISATRNRISRFSRGSISTVSRIAWRSCASGSSAQDTRSATCAASGRADKYSRISFIEKGKAPALALFFAFFGRGNGSGAGCSLRRRSTNSCTFSTSASTWTPSTGSVASGRIVWTR